MGCSFFYLYEFFAARISQAIQLFHLFFDISSF